MQDYAEEGTFCGLDLNVDLPFNKEIIGDLLSDQELGTESTQVHESTKVVPPVLVQSYSSKDEEVDKTINIDPIPTDTNAHEREATRKVEETRSDEVERMTEQVALADQDEN